MFPYFDLAGFKDRTTTFLPDWVDELESRYPGFVSGSIDRKSSVIDARMRKRYGAPGYLPFGQKPPALLPSGTSPPPVSLTGRPVLGCLQVRIQVTTAGDLSTAVVQWSSNRGQSWTAGVAVASGAVVLGATGLTANFPVGAYGTDNLYAAATPVPGIVLDWLSALVTLDCWDRRGRNDADPFCMRSKELYDLAQAQMTEAANSNEGLFDLPISEDLGSSVRTGGPLFYSESSPYVSADRQEREGVLEDERGFGTIGGH